jgi:hypothetical protein
MQGGKMLTWSEERSKLKEEGRIMSQMENHRMLIIEEIKLETARLNAIEALGDLEVGSVWVMGYRKAIELSPTAGSNARTLTLAVLSRLKEIGRPIAIASKTFDETTGKVTFQIPGPLDGWVIRIVGGEPRCKVVPVTEEIDVPITNAVVVGTEKKRITRYVIENPEECGAE